MTRVRFCLLQRKVSRFGKPWIQSDSCTQPYAMPLPQNPSVMCRCCLASLIEAQEKERVMLDKGNKVFSYIRIIFNSFGSKPAYNTVVAFNSSIA